VCGMTVDAATAAAHGSYAGQEYHFCSQGCAGQFRSDPLAVLASAPDPVCAMTVTVAGAQFTADRDGIRYVFCGPGCRDHFLASAAEPATRPGH